jgi:hypothetical protein
MAAAFFQPMTFNLFMQRARYDATILSFQYSDAPNFVRSQFGSCVTFWREKF